MTRLVTDAMLGRLTTYLRMCGHDTVYVGDTDCETDEEIAGFAEREDRLLLTRDSDLAALSERALLLESRDVRTMLSTLIERGIQVELPVTPTYCSACNGSLERVAPDAQTPEYAPDPLAVELWRCTQCGQYYWKGSHWDDVAQTLSSL